MANTPMEVKKASPAPAVPDVLRSFRAEIDRLFERFAGGFGMPSPGSLFDSPLFRLRMAGELPNPAIDLTEDDSGYKVTVELPGMSEKDIDVAVTDDTLTITGEKKQDTERKDKNYHVSERSYGSFRRSFTLPDGVDLEKIGAEFSKGVLTVTLPKNPAAKAAPKKIEVKTAA